MKRRIQVCTALLLIILIGASVGAAGQSSVRDEFTANAANLLEVLDRASYLAITGFSAYDPEDQLVAAQSLINLLEGPGGANYDASLGEVGGDGMLFNSAFSTISNWMDLYEEFPGNEIYVLRDAAVSVESFIRLAYYSALDARDTVYSLLGPENAFRTVYACLVAARGGFDNPFLVAGIQQLAVLFPSVGVPSSAIVVCEGELQALLQAAPDGGMITLEAGVYRERVVITRDITIQGVSPEETILEGVAWDAVIAVMANKSVTVVLKNLTIRSSGKAISSWVYSDDDTVTLTLKNVALVENGIGVIVGKGTSMECSDCRFEGNDLAISAAALGLPAYVILANCTFDGNESAIYVYGNQTITLDACLIQNGTDPDGDISLAGAASLEMRDSELHRVAGRGIVLMDTASMTLINNVIEAVDSHAIAVASTEEGLGSRGTQDCGVFMGWSDAELPLGKITGYGNTVNGGVCPANLLFLIDPEPEPSDGD